jgi:hypothetical protein
MARSFLGLTAPTWPGADEGPGLLRFERTSRAGERDRAKAANCSIADESSCASGVYECSGRIILYEIFFNEACLNEAFFGGFVGAPLTAFLGFTVHSGGIALWALDAPAAPAADVKQAPAAPKGGGQGKGRGAVDTLRTGSWDFYYGDKFPQSADGHDDPLRAARDLRRQG